MIGWEAGTIIELCSSLVESGFSAEDRIGRAGVFIEAAQFAIRDYPIANAWYHKKLAKVQKPVIARKALAHKLARAAYYVVRDRVPFKPELLFR